MSTIEDRTSRLYRSRCRRRCSETDRVQARRARYDEVHPASRPADVAALAIYIMTNTALTGATYDIDGGQQFIAS